MFKHKKIDNDYTLEKKGLNQTKIYFATRKRRICLKGTIFIIFNFRLSWDKWKLFLSNKCGAYGWRNKFSFDLNLFFQCTFVEPLRNCDKISTRCWCMIDNSTNHLARNVKLAREREDVRSESVLEWARFQKVWSITMGEKEVSQWCDYNVMYIYVRVYSI